MVQATVLVPTHDHGPTLYHSVRSALGQTVRDIEVLVVGDGVPDTTREIVAELMREDRRVRFFDNPKGPNRGEVHRHTALQQALGEIVCYLPDDDLWLPDHVETVQALLRQADFVHTLPIWVGADGAVGTWNVDLALPFFREMLQSRANRVPFGCGAHTLAMYRQVPGWRTTPEGPFRDLTDLSMWQQFLAHPACRVGSSARPTAVTFPSPGRAHRRIDERVEELARWTRRLADPAGREEFLMEVLASEARERALLEVHAEGLQEQARAQSDAASGEMARLRAQAEALREGPRLIEELARAQKEAASEEIMRLRRQAEALSERLRLIEEQARAQSADASEELLRLREELRSIRRLPSWRLRQWLLRWPLLERLNVWVGRALGGPAAR